VYKAIKAEHYQYYTCLSTDWWCYNCHAEKKLQKKSKSYADNSDIPD